VKKKKKKEITRTHAYAISNMRPQMSQISLTTANYLKTVGFHNDEESYCGFLGCDIM
jgi:hypothetical protein